LKDRLIRLRIPLALHRRCSQLRPASASGKSGSGTIEIGQLAKARLVNWPIRGGNLCPNRAVYALVSLLQEDIDE